MIPESTTCVLKLRLGTCLTGPSKRLVADLHEASHLQNLAANAMVRYWERWCEDNLFEVKEVLIKGKKNVTTGAAARPRTIRVRQSIVPESYALPQGFSTELYHAGLAVAPTLAANIVASVSNKLLSFINKKAPLGHKAKRVWQGILGNEMSRPCFRHSEIDVPNSSAKLSLSDSGYTIQFPLWSKASGRKNTAYVCRLGSRRLPAGYKRIMLKVASGAWKLCDSKLHWHDAKSRRGKGHWALHLTYKRPQEPLAGLDKSRVATLSLCGKDAKKPFEIAADGTFPWMLGDVAVYQNEYGRLETRRLEMRNRHRDKSSGRRGHGRKRVEDSIRPVSRAVKNLMHRFQWRVVSEAVRYCERYGCGSVEFSEPNTWQKSASWFGVAGRPWDWAGFVRRLKHKLRVNGIELRESGGGEPNAGCRSRSPNDGQTGTSGDGAKKSGTKRAKKVAGSRGGPRKSRRNGGME